ncbi:MAG TPA: hypothetical protein VFW68_01675 [Rhodocyclaceae bacterium]|nr:hypothetical protein [Rhodocyclaceae bacterium]
MQLESEVVVMKARTGFLLALALLLGACAHRQDAPQTFGEAMQERGASNKEVGDKWQRGSEKVERGTRMTEESRKDEAEGQRLIREGRNEMREAEEEGQRVRRQPLGNEPTTPPGPAEAPKAYPQY